MRYRASRRTGIKNIYLLGAIGLLILVNIIRIKIEPLLREQKENWPTNGRAVEVYDGDTFKLANGMIVRLLGVDAADQGDLGKKAKEELTKLIVGKKLTLKYGAQAEDDFGRLSAWVWVDNKLVQQELADKKVVTSNMGNLSSQNLTLPPSIDSGLRPL